MVDINQELSQAQAHNAIAWILANEIKNENGYPIEFDDHSFLIEPYLDITPRQAIRKCAQIGWSVLAILRSFHLARYAGANVIHTFPSRSVSRDFVVPKVDPLINRNPVIANMVGVSSTSLKQVGDRFIYYRGSYEQSEAISISAHILINDEFDRSNQKVVRTYRSRLDDARRERPELGWEWIFSNPSIPSFGVDDLFQRSDMKYWIVKCSHCNKRQYIRWPESIDLNKKLRVCLKCGKEITPADLKAGEWVAKYPGREISGYWVSQLFIPWIPVSKIIEDSEGDQEIFYNFTLGQPYIDADLSVSREDIVKCISPGVNSRRNVSIGVDNGVIKHYVVGNREGIFEIGTTKDWQDIEDLRNRFNAVMVIDANPYPKDPMRLVKKYPGKVFMHYYASDKNNIELIKWGEGDKRGVVYSHRTKFIDHVVNEITSGDFTFQMTLTTLENEGYINHWSHIYRTVEEKPIGSGTFKPAWKKLEGKHDDYAHATIYWRLGLERVLGTGGRSLVLTRTPGGNEKLKSVSVSPDGRVPSLDFKDVAIRAARRALRRGK